QPHTQQPRTTTSKPTLALRQRNPQPPHLQHQPLQPFRPGFRQRLLPRLALRQRNPQPPHLRHRPLRPLQPHTPQPHTTPPTLPPSHPPTPPASPPTPAPHPATPDHHLTTHPRPTTAEPTTAPPTTPTPTAIPTRVSTAATSQARPTTAEPTTAPPTTPTPTASPTPHPATPDHHLKTHPRPTVMRCTVASRGRARPIPWVVLTRVMLVVIRRCRPPVATRPTGCVRNPAPTA